MERCGYPLRDGLPHRPADLGDGRLRPWCARPHVPVFGHDITETPIMFTLQVFYKKDRGVRVRSCNASQDRREPGARCGVRVTPLIFGALSATTGTGAST